MIAFQKVEEVMEKRGSKRSKKKPLDEDFDGFGLTHPTKPFDLLD